VVPAEAIPELAAELRLGPGGTLLDLACGRGAYGLLIAKKAGSSVVGVDFSAQALAEAREQAARMDVSGATFRVGELTATGLPDAFVEAVLCTDSIQFPDEPALAYGEIRRVLKPGGRVVLTCWEALDRNDERLSLRVRRADLGAGLHQAGFTDVEVRERPSWLARVRAQPRRAPGQQQAGRPVVLGDAHCHRRLLELRPLRGHPRKARQPGRDGVLIDTGPVFSHLAKIRTGASPERGAASTEGTVGPKAAVDWIRSWPSPGTRSWAPPRDSVAVNNTDTAAPKGTVLAGSGHDHEGLMA
jgi:SAM-dependent methyltransferase